MTIEVVTQDCSRLSDSELGDMADLSSRFLGWEVGLIGKQAAEWVLSVQVRDHGKLQAFAFATLERIGGTPAIMLGLGCVERGATSQEMMQRLMQAQYHKALMAFPDEDVVVAARAVVPSPLEAFEGLDRVRPCPGVRVGGEDRAWGRRLAERFGADGFDDRTMVARSDSELLAFDYESIDPPDGSAIFGDAQLEAGDYVLIWGWAMAELLEKYDKPCI